MTNDLDRRLTGALTKAAQSTHTSDDAFAAIIDRAGPTSSTRQTNRWLLAGGITATVAIAVGVTMTAGDRGSPAPVMAAIQVPALGGTDDCSSVTGRDASPDEAAQVAYLPGDLPAGYTLAETPSAGVQTRAASRFECWSADVTFVDPATGRLLAVTVKRQGVDVQPDCRLPDGYLPAQCTTVGGVPAAITDEGSRASISWITAEDHFADVSGYGFTADELIAVAESVGFDGTRISVQAPAGMDEIENAARTRTDDRQIVSYGARFTNGTPAEDIWLTVTTWNDFSVNEVGPGDMVGLDGTEALVVTTGGPGTGITGWTNSPGSADPLDVSQFERPAAAYITWNAEGLTFRIEGPDANTVSFVARQLRAA